MSGAPIPHRRVSGVSPLPLLEGDVDHARLHRKGIRGTLRALGAGTRVSEEQRVTARWRKAAIHAAHASPSSTTFRYRCSTVSGRLMSIRIAAAIGPVR